jgi:adenylosuccinate lyase
MPLPPQPLSPLDGRYAGAVSALGEHLSEAGLNRARVHVEVEWLLLLTDRGAFGVAPLAAADREGLRAWASDFGAEEIDWLAAKERETRHDVKAVEYLIRRELETRGLTRVAELVHFAATSEDINNLAYAITIRDAVHEVWLPAFDTLIGRLTDLASATADAAMLARTHGQPATPTTMGKELAVTATRLRRQRDRVAAIAPLGKFNGATGTYAAHLAADPDLDWAGLSDEFVTSLGLTWNPLTTQIESHDWQAEIYQAASLAGRILHAFCVDVWTYISIGYFRQIPVAGATGSSTMPHKVNPIRFENAEANLELASALLDSLAATLVESRLQRDLTDSTTQRNIGVAFGHSLLAIDNVTRGLSEIDLDRDRLATDLDANWEVLAEAIQTVIRAEVAAGRSGITDPYALLKELTRGRRVGPAEFAAFIEGLEIGDAARARLLALTPATYTGLAAQLATRG